MKTINDLIEWKFPDVTKVEEGVSSREREMLDHISQQEAKLASQAETIEVLNTRIVELEHALQAQSQTLITKLSDINNMIQNLDGEMREITLTIIKKICHKIIIAEMTTNPNTIRAIIDKVIHQQKINGIVKVEVARDFIDLLVDLKLDPAMLLEVNAELNQGDMIISYLGKSWVYKIDYMIDQMLKQGNNHVRA